MDRYAIVKQRKELKKCAHKTVKSHYMLLVFLTLLLAFFGTEFTDSVSGLKDHGSLNAVIYGKEEEPAAQEAEVSLSEGSTGKTAPLEEILDEIFLGNLRGGQEKSEQLAEDLSETASDSAAFGRTNGIFAELVNNFFSGKLYMEIARFLYSVTKSETAVGVIFLLAIGAFYLLFYIFFQSVLSAAVRRLFLEARVYEQVEFSDILHFPAVKRWRRAALTTFLTDVRTILWWLTVIGGPIKTCSYFCVPFIVAENPDLRPREAIRLSRKMMDGHKWEYFLFSLSFILWYLLGTVTLGLSNLFYGNAYLLSAHTEFYVKVREDAKKRGVEGTEALDDRCLFEKADRIELAETYFDVVDEITLIQEDKVKLTGLKRFAARWFGVWLGSYEEKKRYDDVQGRKEAVRRERASLRAQAYPQRLNPRWQEKEMAKKEKFHFIRYYPIPTLFLMFISFSFVGWVWEVALHLLQTGQFANRGTLFGPWLPIYGTGGVVVLMLCSRFRKNPAAEFVTAVVLCGFIEYMSSVYLEMKFHERWWSYDGYFLNLNGRICAEGLLVFGVGCCFVVYVCAPLFDLKVASAGKKKILALCAVLLVLYGADLIHSSGNPNMAEGAVESAEEAAAETSSAESAVSAPAGAA